jgi:dolichyl-diphosphooligosaccharide--protein glycosyltransferase
MAAFAGVGFVCLLSWLEVLAPVPWSPTGDAARDPDPVTGVAVPDRRRLVAVGGLSALFLGFPSAFTAVIGSRATTDRRRYAAARWMREYAERRGWSPSNRYVLSEWGENRMYNYFVAGRSRSYGYAQRNYGRFLFSTNPGEWYDRLKGRVRFVVVEGRPVDLPPYSTYDTLFERFGSAGERAPGLAHYRAVYADRAAGIVAFTLVPGATIEGRTDGTGTVAVSTEVTLPEASFTYERRVRPDADGSYAVRVPYPGAYRVDGRRVVVEEAAVEDGRRVPVE